MKITWWIGLGGILVSLWLMVACTAPTNQRNQTPPITTTTTQPPNPLTITITTDLQLASLNTPLVLTQTEPLVWLALTPKDPESTSLTSAEVGVEQNIYPAPLLSINGLGQQTLITTETYGLIYREQGLPLPILYRPNPDPNQPFSAQIFADRAEISWRGNVQFSPNLEYVAIRTLSVGASTSSDTSRLEIINLQTNKTRYIGEGVRDLRVQSHFIGWSNSEIYEISARHNSVITRFDLSQTEPNIQSWYVRGEAGFDDYFLDMQHGLLAFAQNGIQPGVGVKHLSTDSNIVVESGNSTISIDNLSISPDGRYLAYLYHPTITEYDAPSPGNIRLYSIEQQQALGELAIGVNPDMVREYFTLLFDGTMLLWTPDSQYLFALSCDQRTPWIRAYATLDNYSPTCDAASPIKQQRRGLVFRLADQRQLTEIVLPAHTGSIKLISPNLLSIITYVNQEAFLIVCDITTGQQTVPLALGKVVPVIVYPR